MYYRAFWQRRCRAAAAEAVLKPLGGNYAVLPQDNTGGKLVFFMQNAPLLCQRGAEKLFFAAVNAGLAQQVLDDLGPADQPAGGGHKGVAGGGLISFALRRSMANAFISGTSLQWAQFFALPHLHGGQTVLY